MYDDEESEDSIKFLLYLQDKPIPHRSILEFINFGVNIICSRIASHEIVRHRHTAYMQSSTRYIYVAKSNVVDLIDPELSHPEQVTYHNPIRRPDIMGVYPKWLPSSAESIKGYISSINNGSKIEQARYLLPHNIKVNIIVNTNFSEWLHMFKVRTDSAAAPEMQYIFNKVKDEFSENVLRKWHNLSDEEVDNFWKILLRTDRDEKCANS
jgi:thymidylate synthase (FAD)